MRSASIFGICLAVGVHAAELPFALPEAVAKEDRHLHGLRTRLSLAEALLEKNRQRDGFRQLEAVETTVDGIGDGFVFRSGTQLGEDHLGPTRANGGFRFGARRSGHQGKSWTLSSLARHYAENGELAKAQETVRRIPSTHVQFHRARWLVGEMIARNRFREAEGYRQAVLMEAGWDPDIFRTEERLYGNQAYKFASRTAFALLAAHQRNGRPQEADRLAAEIGQWLEIRNLTDLNPDLTDYRDLSLLLVRYFIDTGRPERAEKIVDACIAKWERAVAPVNEPMQQAVIERNRENQLAIYELALALPPNANFQIQSASLTRFPADLTAQFVEIELLEGRDRKAAIKTYERLGREILADGRRCKRYLPQVTEALTRLGAEEIAIELLGALQEALPTKKIDGCPITAFQEWFFRRVKDLDLAPIVQSMRLHEEKLTTPERLQASGLALAKTYASAGDLQSARRVLDRVARALPAKDPYATLSGVVAARHELFGETRLAEVERLVRAAQATPEKRSGLKESRLAAVARLFISMERYDWAEALIDALSPESRVE